MPINVSHIFTALLASNRSPDPQRPGSYLPADYGLSAELSGATIQATLTFRCGVAYCCESGCHLPLNNGERWQRLRELLKADQIDPPETLTVRLSCMIEAGALVFDLTRPQAKRRDWFELRSEPKWQYGLEVSELA